MTVYSPIPVALLESYESSLIDFPLFIVVANPGDEAEEVATSIKPLLRVAHLTADPAVVPAGYFSLEIEIDMGSGFVTAYTSLGGFQAPWNGAGSTETFHTASSPYTFTELTFDYTTGTLPHDTTLTFRVTGTDPIGWGHFAWCHEPWGHGGSPTEVLDTYSFDTADETAPKLLSAVATARDVVQLTFDDNMSVDTPDGRAYLTTATDETAWGALAIPGTITLAIDGGVATEYTVDETMLSIAYAPTAVDVANALSSLIDGVTAVPNADGTVNLYSDTEGDSSSLQISGGTLNTTLQFPTSLATGNDTSALSAVNYLIERNNVYPAVAVHLTPTSIAAEDSDNIVFDMSVQWPMTPAAPYTVTVESDVTDDAGNAIDASYLSASFTGYQPDIPDGRVVKFPIPDRAYELDDTQELRAFVNALEEAWNLFLTDVDSLPDVWDPDRCDSTRLELHLTDQGNPFTWAELDLTEAQRKKLLRMLPDLYAYRGTNTGIEAAILTLLEIECTVVAAMEDVWTLGEDLLGDYYPAQVIAANPETYNLSAAGMDLWLLIDEGHAVMGVDTGTGRFTLAGRSTSQYTVGYQFRIYGSTGNDGLYTVTAAVETGDNTIVTVAEAVPSGVADGVAIQTIQFSDVAGVDFVAPAAATADEVATAIAATIVDGAAAALNPGTGNTVAVASSTPGGTIQVVGGTANVALGFDTAVHSSTGGCVLGPGTARARHTFDLVVTDTLPSTEEQVLMRRVANWAKPVNRHLGRIRLAYVVEDDGIWRLGRSRLGADTVLG